ncbi:MAG: Rrf2 family transcriptional regulator [Rhodothermales bacterium]|nr:Rrf2 family transcriptional regulator [Rhodothermales bacterium]
MLYLALRPGASYVPVHEISDKLDVSKHFLAKIIQQLAATGLLRSHRGPNGGVTLARSADRILLAQIIEAIDGRKVFESCVLGMPGCGTATPCPLHDEWGPARDRFNDIMHSNSLRDVADRTREKGYRLSSRELFASINFGLMSPDTH